MSTLASTTAFESPGMQPGESLHIGMVAPPWFQLPPQGYGGTEAVVAALVDQLVSRGHRVTLVGAGPAGTKAQQFIASYDEPPSHLLGHSAMPEVIHAAVASQVFRDEPVDIVHDHSLAGPLLAAGRTVPTVATMHGPVSGDNGAYFDELGLDVDLIAISHAQRRQAPHLNWVGTVHNAIDVASFPFQSEKSDYVLWIGRFCADKAPDLAIKAARKAGRKIVLAGKLNETAEKEYFDNVVRPLLGPDAEYVGEADASLKRELYAGARCMVFPIQWEEPFGMVMVEAMACGTPVVATRRGSVPEVIEDGVTGFIVDEVSQLADAIDRADELSARACRDRVTERFDLPVMAAGYEQIYRMLVSASRDIRGLTSAAL